MDKVETDTAFAGSIPEVYDRLMVPLIFEPYAQDLARRVAMLKPARVTTPVPAAVSSTRAGFSMATRRARSCAYGSKISGTMWVSYSSGTEPANTASEPILSMVRPWLMKRPILGGAQCDA